MSKKTEKQNRRATAMTAGWGRRLTSLVLCLVMAFLALPLTTYAASSDPTLNNTDKAVCGAYYFGLATEAQRQQWIRDYVNLNPSAYLGGISTDSTAYQTYKQDSKTYSSYLSSAVTYSDKDFMIVQNASAYAGRMVVPLSLSFYYPHYLPLKGTYLKMYRQEVAAYWWSKLSDDQKTKYIIEWANTAKAKGMTAEKIGSSVEVQVTQKMLSTLGSRFDNVGDATLILPEADMPAFCSCFGVIPEQRYSNVAYVLRVKTGINAGTNVLYLGVRFKDMDGVSHTEFLFPHEGSLSEGYAAIEQVSTPAKRLKIVEDVSGYTVSNNYQNPDGLMANSVDYYYFKPGFEIQQLEGIDVFMRYPTDGTSTKGWTCAGMQFFRVDELYGMEMSGFYSDAYHISFRGELMSKLVITASDSTVVDFELEKTDVLFRIGREEDTSYYLERNLNQPYDNHEDTYYFKLDIADINNGGLESLATEYTDGTRLKDVVEALTLRLTYMDIYGDRQTLCLPMITSELAWAVEQGWVSSSLPIAGVAQQGECVMFPATIPDLDEMLKVELICGTGAVDAANLKLASGSSTIRDRRTQALERDDFHITGMQIYHATTTNVKGKVEGAVLNLTVDDNCAPMQYFVTNGSEGISMQEGVYDMTERLKPYQPGKALKPVKAGAQYVVVITTDNISRAGTTEDITFKLGYLSTTGEEKETDFMNLNSTAREVYGYWPGLNGDTAYQNSVSAGRQLIFPLEINDVNRFLNVTFAMSESSNDDWQMSDISIYSFSELGPRKIEWKAASGSDRLITRSFDASPDRLVAHFPNALDIVEYEDGSDDPEQQETAKVYLGGGSYIKMISFGETSRSVLEERRLVDWNKIRYSMSLAEAKQDLAFAVSTSTYKVEVKVASNSEGSYGDGDCGSQNLFYFKLVFENGSSGYVLANQQLTADGFRADRIETFYISTNEDYGALTAVSIIPEDDSGSDNQDPFDKLNISYIDITKQSSESLALTWRVDNVGWLDINYRDKGAEETATGRVGRSEGELAHTYIANSCGYSLNLLFTMTTDGYERDASDVYASSGSDHPQYRGSMTATVEYYTNTGIIRKQSVDIVRAMYDYAGITPVYYNDTYQTENGTQETRCKSDTGFMFRGSHVDRFILSLTDVKQLIRITFNASSEVSTLWRLNNVKVYQIESSGTLQLDAHNEYKRNNKTSLLCESTDILGYELKVFAPKTSAETLGAQQSMKVSFSNHNIEVDTGGSNWTSSITREPANKNDILNFFIFMADGDENEEIDSYKVTSSIKWHSTLTDNYQETNIGELTASKDGNMFYYQGLKVQGFDAMEYVKLLGNSRNGIMARGKYMVIQHIRSGVMIHTYYADMSSKNLLATSIGAMVSADELRQANWLGKSQRVELHFSPDMERSPIINKDGSDLAVAIRYRTVQDEECPEISETVTYNSRYYYLSDLVDPDTGEQLYNRIEPGSTVAFTFQEAFIQDIVGVTVATVGGYTVKLDSAYAGIYDTATGEYEKDKWYNFADSAEISMTPYTLLATETNVGRVKMTFKTSQDAEVVSYGMEGGDVPPVRMTVAYTSNFSGTREEYIIEDLRDYLIEGDLKAGNTAVVEFFMRDVSNIRSITLEPYTNEDETSAAWGVEQVLCETLIEGSPKSHLTAVNKLVVKDYPVNVNLSTVLMQVITKYFSGETQVNVEHKSDFGGTNELEIASGRSVTITPLITGSLPGYGYDVTVTRGDGATILDCCKPGEDSSQFIFTAPGNSGTEPQVYTICICSEEIPEVKCYVIVKERPEER